MNLSLNNQGASSTKIERWWINLQFLTLTLSKLQLYRDYSWSKIWWTGTESAVPLPCLQVSYWAKIEVWLEGLKEVIPDRMPSSLQPLLVAKIYISRELQRNIWWLPVANPPCGMPSLLTSREFLLFYIWGICWKPISLPLTSLYECQMGLLILSLFLLMSKCYTVFKSLAFSTAFYVLKIVLKCITTGNDVKMSLANSQYPRCVYQLKKLGFLA